MICENCGKEHDGCYGSGRFCCKKCARSYSTKNDKKNLKPAKCIDCGKLLYISKRASVKNCRCEECKRNYIIEKCKISNKKYNIAKKCQICGRIYLKGSGGCENLFCKEHYKQGFELLIKYFGFNEKLLGTPDVEKEYNRIRNIIYDLYWYKNLSAELIATIFNFPSKHCITQTIFKFLNIPCRNFKEAVKVAYTEGRIDLNKYKNRYKSEYHKSWNNKEVYLRSSYEIDYANELDTQKIEYEVEKLRIKYFDTQRNEYRCAIPDFYLPNTNTIVEIKSTWTLDVQQMKDKVKAYKDLGYNFKLIVEHNEENINNIIEIKNKQIIYKK